MKIRIMTGFLVLIFISIPALCKQDSDELIKSIVRDLADSKIEKSLPHFAVNIEKEKLVVILTQISASIKQIEYQEIEQVYYSNRKSLTKDFSSDMYVYHIKGKYMSLLLTTYVQSSGSDRKITGFHTNPAPLDLNDMHPFTFSNKSTIQYTFLALAILISLFILYSAYKCFRSEIKMKWLWMLLIFVSAGKIGVLWNDASLSETRITNPQISINLLGGYASKFPIFEPWFIYISFPIGALLFWWKYKKQNKDISMQSKP